MAGQYKISVRKIMQALLTLVLSTGCIVAMVSASRLEGETKVKDVLVHNVNGKKYHFVEDKEILKEATEDRGVVIDTNTPIKTLDLRGMETALRKDAWIETADVHIDNNNVIHISVKQRMPMVRLFMQSGKSLYMDNSLHLMPLSKIATFYTLAVTNVPDLGTDSLGMSIKYKLRTLARAIQSDTFWNAQVSEIVMDSATCFSLVPIAGDQNIVFGDTTRLQEKLSNLYSFYLGVLNKIGWERYQTLDLRFKGQVVASPALPYTGPVDKVNKSWIAGMIEAEARKDSLLTALEPRKSNAPRNPVRLLPSGDKKITEPARPEKVVVKKGNEKLPVPASHAVKGKAPKTAKPKEKHEDKKTEAKKADVKKDRHAEAPQKAKVEPLESNKETITPPKKDNPTAAPKKEGKQPTVVPKKTEPTKTRSEQKIEKVSQPKKPVNTDKTNNKKQHSGAQ